MPLYYLKGGESILEKLKQIREERNLSKTYMAKKLGLSLQGYRHLENGSVRMSADRILAISKILGVDVTIFFEQ
ncbi:helix-turn-helix domain-containing protein [Paenibacillus alvei]|uniref:helix-turn-helix domain-containing protein n=1 Tax=Paenibacillus alvei TaxID=44250 RepID=UPI0009DAF4CA|nr:helix-turn-helix transcriptional regulator [Paenibacillus alvei]